MKEIFLITSDGYRDNINLKFAAKDEKSLKGLLKIDFDNPNFKLIENSIKIDWKKGKITFKYFDDIEDYSSTENGEYTFITLKILK